MSNTSLQAVKLKLGMNLLDEKNLVWTEKRNSPYRYHAVLEYKPAGMEIEQASETSYSEAKGYCLKELHWRLKNGDDYKKS